MYYSFYGLKDNPFELSPDGSYVYMSETHQEGLATLRYGVIANKGFLLLTGGVGVGKTTLLNALIRLLQKKVIVCLLNNPTLSKDEFYHYLAAKFDLAYDNNKSKFILELEELLVRCREKGEKILLIIDEAQAFSIELLEEVRLLSNLAGQSNVFGIFLVGQPEIRQQLATNQLLPLRQRIGIRYHLEPFSTKDTGEYINFRLNRAGGGTQRIFTENAVTTIHDASQGNPRLINILCDHALLTGFARDKRLIEKELIVESIEELRLPGEDTLQTSEVRSWTIAQPSEFVRRPVPQSYESERHPTPDPADFVRESEPDPPRADAGREPKPSDSASQPDQPQAEVDEQTAVEAAETVSREETTPSEVSSTSTPQASDVETQSEPEQTGVAGEKRSQRQKPVRSTVAPQASDVGDQPEPTKIEAAGEKRLQRQKVVNKPMQPDLIGENQQESHEPEVASRSSGAKNPLVHIVVASLLMSAIIVLGIIIPPETLNLFSGPK